MVNRNAVMHESTDAMPSRRGFLRAVGALGVAGALTGCDTALEQLADHLDAAGPEGFRPPEGDEIDLARHVLNRLTFGPRPEDAERIERLGVEAFIEEQLHPETIPDRRAEWRVNTIASLDDHGGELYNHHPQQLLEDMTRAKLLRAVYSRRQLHEVMVDFWSDHFNIASNKGDCRWIKAADDREVIRPHALGRFSDLLRASMLSPAMLIYLDGHDNKVRHPDERPNENYARELLELHTLGVHGGYTQRDVMEVARCLSGWTYENRFWTPYRVRFEPSRHDHGEKHVLGVTIPAGAGGDDGAADLDRVLEIVVRHPATALHISTRLCRRFIHHDPPRAVVERTAEAFRASDGDLRATLRTLFASKAFRSMRGNLFKRPFRFVTSALRATGARTDGGSDLMRLLERMGHAPFQYPTPDGYPMEPEPWLGSLLWRWNFAVALARDEVNGTRVERAWLVEMFGDETRLAAHLLGRRPTEVEAEVLRDEASLALLLAAPAFQMH